MISGYYDKRGDRIFVVTFAGKVLLVTRNYLMAKALDEQQ